MVSHWPVKVMTSSTVEGRKGGREASLFWQHQVRHNRRLGLINDQMGGGGGMATSQEPRMSQLLQHRTE